MVVNVKKGKKKAPVPNLKNDGSKPDKLKLDEIQDFTKFYKTDSETKLIKKKFNNENTDDAPKKEKQKTKRKQGQEKVESDKVDSTEQNISDHNKPKKSRKRNRTKSSANVITAVNDDHELSNTKKIKPNTPGEKVKTKKNKKEAPKSSIENVIESNLEELSLGDNAHTLSSLIDDMEVVTKSSKVKAPTNKFKIKKGKNFKHKNDVDVKKTEETPDKPKWTKKKWNKGRKTTADHYLNTTLKIDNLPLKLILKYKKVLTDHLSKYGTIRGFGVAEVYPSVESKPVFSTTVSFSEQTSLDAAIENEVFTVEGNKVHLKRILSPEETTIVLKSYGDLSEGRMSSMFSSCGRLRKITSIKKGKKMSTAFIEFDGPEAVEKALKLVQSDDSKKKLYASRYGQKLKIDTINKEKIQKDKNKKNSESESNMNSDSETNVNSEDEKKQAESSDSDSSNEE